MHITLSTRHVLAVAVVCAVALAGCDQQQPLAHTPRPEPGIKAGETSPVEPDKGPKRNSDGDVPLPPATTPATPGEQNSPSAPVPFTSPPASSSTKAPVLAPPGT